MYDLVLLLGWCYVYSSSATRVCWFTAVVLVRCLQLSFLFFLWGFNGESLGGFCEQVPKLRLRGRFYEGWQPCDTPTNYNYNVHS